MKQRFLASFALQIGNWIRGPDVGDIHSSIRLPSSKSFRSLLFASSPSLSSSDDSFYSSIVDHRSRKLPLTGMSLSITNPSAQCFLFFVQLHRFSFCFFFFSLPVHLNSIGENASDEVIQLRNISAWERGRSIRAFRPLFQVLTITNPVKTVH